MSRYTVAVVGTGPDPENPTVESFAMGYRHAEAYCNHPDCELVACADLVPENAAAFAAEFGIDEGNVFEDYEAMAEAVEPDLVSVTVPPDVHEQVVVDLAETGVVDAVHCEKPMADTLAAAERMVEACDELGVQLTFNRQRRFGKPFTEADRLVSEGAIGDLRRIEIAWGDFFDTGAHTIDLAGMFNDETPAEWTIAQLDYREEDLRFGVHQENQMWAQWRYENGVYGVMSTGEGGDFLDCAMALRGPTARSASASRAARCSHSAPTATSGSSTWTARPCTGPATRRAASAPGSTTVPSRKSSRRSTPVRSPSSAAG